MTLTSLCLRLLDVVLDVVPVADVHPHSHQDTGDHRGYLLLTVDPGRVVDYETTRCKRTLELCTT